MVHVGRKETAKQTEGNNNPAQEEEAVLDPNDNTHLSRLLLAQSAAQTLMANKPGQPEVTVTAPVAENDGLSVPWDAPLMSARQSALSPEIDGSGYISPCSIYSIEADLMAEKEGLLDEEDKHELARRLEQEVAGSILELWRERLTQPMVPSDIEIEYESDDDLSTGGHTPTSTSPRSPPSPNHKNSLGQRSGSSALAYLKGRRSRKGSAQSDCSEEGNKPLEAARLKLRKTRFDYNSDSVHRPTEVTPPQVDFRHVLKKSNKPTGD